MTAAEVKPDDSFQYQTAEDDSVPLDPNSKFYLDHVSRYWWAADQAVGKSVLDCACGKGYGSYIMSHKAKRVLGVDLNPESLAIASETFKRDHLEYRKRDVLEVASIEGQFDLITAFEIIEHIHPPTTDDFVSAIARALNPQGKLLLSTPNHDVVLKSGVYVPDFHINNLRATETKAVLSRHFSQVTMLGQWVPKGGLRDLVFQLDFFNWRHLLRHLRRSTPSESAPVAAEKPKTPEKPDAKMFDEPPEKIKPYRFDPNCWRQAGLTVAVCEGPK